MKIPLALAAATLLAFPPLHAEDKPASALPLMPDATPGIDNPKPVTPEDGRAAKPSKTQIAEDEIQQRIHLREAKNKALNDPAVQAEWNKSQRAKTDFDKREALKRYYALLYGRVRKIDPTVTKLADDRQSLALRRLAQTRVDPTEPLDPDERTSRD